MRRLALSSALALVAGVSTFLTPPAVAAVVINVPASQPTIQAGIDAASDGDTVVVAPGTYFEHIDFKGKAIEVRSSGGPRTTIIDGGGTYHVVLFISGEERTSVLKGFTITHGAFPATQPAVLAGSGIGIDQASPTITGNIITANGGGAHNGAGIGVIGGAPLIKDNFISNNAAGPLSAGGGIFAGDDAEIVMNTLEGNTAGSGAGIHVFGGTPLVSANFLRGNHAGAFSGGGLFVGTASGTYVNNVMLENVSDAAGGGVYLLSEALLPSLLNNSVIRNQASTGAGVAIGSGQPSLINNLIAGAPAQALLWCAPAVALGTNFRHNDVYNETPSPYAGCADPTGTQGNISADPLLTAVGPNYVPDAGSPTIDAGDNGAPSLPTTDLYGNARVTDGDGDGDAVVDMGAVERAGVPFAGADYHSLTPARILDTRMGNGAPAARIGPASTIALQVAGRGGVPAAGVRAVVLNLTVTEPTAVSFLTAWPAGAIRRPRAAS